MRVRVCVCACAMDEKSNLVDYFAKCSNGIISRHPRTNHAHTLPRTDITRCSRRPTTLLHLLLSKRSSGPYFRTSLQQRVRRPANTSFSSPPPRTDVASVSQTASRATIALTATRRAATQASVTSMPHPLCFPGDLEDTDGVHRPHGAPHQCLLSVRGQAASFMLTCGCTFR